MTDQKLGSARHVADIAEEGSTVGTIAVVKFEIAGLFRSPEDPQGMATLARPAVSGMREPALTGRVDERKSE